MTTALECMLLLVLIGFGVTAFIILRKGLPQATQQLTLQQVNPEADITTILPISAHSAICDHDWEVMAERVLEMPHEKKSVLVMACRRCGIVDKTVQSTSPPPPCKTDCHHKWETEKKITLESAYEQILKSDDKRIEIDLSEAQPWMFRKSYVSIRICSVCGELDKVITSNFELAEGEELPADWPDSIKLRDKKRA